MSKKLKDRARYDQAMKALTALGEMPSEFCIMVDVIAIINFVAEAEADNSLIDLEYVVEALAGDGMAYDDSEYRLKEAGAMLEDVTC